MANALELEPFRVVRDLNDLCLDYVKDGIFLRQHLGHQILTVEGGWAVVLVSHRVRHRGEWQEPEFRLMRLKKRHNVWYHSTHFRISSELLQSLGRAIPNNLENAYETAEELDYVGDDDVDPV